MPFPIAHTHPALDGHFPGQPIVPAVVILDEVLAAASQAGDFGQVVGVIKAKFTAVLRPGQCCSIDFAPAVNGLRFTCQAEGQTIATGLLALAPGTS